MTESLSWKQSKQSMLVAHISDLHLGRKSPKKGDPHGAERLNSFRQAIATLAALPAGRADRRRRHLRRHSGGAGDHRRGGQDAVRRPTRKRRGPARGPDPGQPRPGRCRQALDRIRSLPGALRRRAAGAGAPGHRAGRGETADRGVSLPDALQCRAPLGRAIAGRAAPTPRPFAWSWLTARCRVDRCRKTSKTPIRLLRPIWNRWEQTTRPWVISTVSTRPGARATSASGASPIAARTSRTSSAAKRATRSWPT